MTYRQPWSKKHKKVTAATPYSLSNSFAQPLTSEELIDLSLERGDQEIVDCYYKHSLDYTPNGGSIDLRTEIANLYGPNITLENIIVFPGAQIALQTAASALLHGQSHSIVFTPGYQSVQEAPAHAGSQVTKIRLLPEDGWQIDPKKVKAAIKHNTKYIVINEPYNPAGTLMGHKLQEQLIKIAAENNIHVMSDEVYRLLEHDPKDRLPAMADFYANGLSACTLSKPWGGCGITIGWLVLQDMDLKQRIIDTQYFATACPSRASEIQAIMTLRASDIILDKNMKIIRHNMKLLDQFFDEYSVLFEWIRPKAGAVAYVKFKGPLSTDELGTLLAASGISIKPAYVFSEEGANCDDYFRVGYGEEKMPAALDALIAFVEEHKEEWRI